MLLMSPLCIVYMPTVGRLASFSAAGRYAYICELAYEPVRWPFLACLVCLYFSRTLFALPSHFPLPNCLRPFFFGNKVNAVLAAKERERLQRESAKRAEEERQERLRVEKEMRTKRDARAKLSFVEDEGNDAEDDEVAGEEEATHGNGSRAPPDVPKGSSRAAGMSTPPAPTDRNELFSKCERHLEAAT